MSAQRGEGGGGRAGHVEKRRVRAVTTSTGERRDSDMRAFEGDMPDSRKLYRDCAILVPDSGVFRWRNFAVKYPRGK